jgi:hypothetical protein
MAPRKTKTSALKSVAASQPEEAKVEVDLLRVLAAFLQEVSQMPVEEHDPEVISRQLIDLIGKMEDERNQAAREMLIRYAQRFLERIVTAFERAAMPEVISTPEANAFVEEILKEVFRRMRGGGW